ncbi:MAC/perforin domain-containing protein [uncultured Bacteroides sp.]|uniref:MAC/perforin domain-containing protein n=1 Tax=uncultured Bacteroides sp. TaxID=162156 RepID=UPI0025FC7C77|nr:MAC/perforin domain-containing protein [uncultured Bacteroides sp.]
MKQNYYQIVILAFFLWGCQQNEAKPEVIPPEVKPQECADITLRIEVATDDTEYNFIDLLGRGFDCKKSIIKGYTHIRSRVLDIDRLQNEVEKSRFYQSGDFIINGEKNLKRYIDNIYLNSRVNAKIGDEVLNLFAEDVGNTEENLQSNEFYKVEYIRPTGRFTLFDTYPEYLYNFLSKEFIDDLEKCSGDEIVIRYGTHVLTDILLGGYMSISCTAKHDKNQYDVDLKRQAQYYSYEIFSSNYSVNPARVFAGYDEVKIHVRVIGGVESHITLRKENEISGYQNWNESIDYQKGKLIGIGQSTTRIYLISDFIQDAKKKSEIKDAILKYCNH